MLSFEDEALVLSALPHGENGAVVRFLAMQGGLRAGFVPGARGKTKRALLHPGNRVALSLRARADGQLPAATVELLHSRALLSFEPGSASLLAWLSELTATSLAEAVPHPRLAMALDALLSGLCADMDLAAARAALARYELLLLEEEGFGLDLSSCALGGDPSDLAFVSPRTGRAVSRAKARGQTWAAQLLPLPHFLLSGGPATQGETAGALALSGHFLSRHWPRSASQQALRERAIAGARTSPIGSAHPTA